MRKLLCAIALTALAALGLGGAWAPAALAVGTAEADSDLFFLGHDYSPIATQVDLRDMEYKDVTDAVRLLSRLPKLERVLLGSESENALPLSVLKRIHDACPQAVLDYQFTLYGKSFNLADETMNLRHVAVPDQGTLLRRYISLMTALNYLDMDSCGVDNIYMDAIRKDFPQVKVVWRIRFGDNYTARTDAVRILASCPDWGGELINSNTYDLKYCIYVKYLDLGHNNKLETLDFIRYMPDLEVGIFAMSNIDDFSALASCPKLEYLEIQTCRLYDLSPLSGLKNLRHLNICYSFSVNDISPLYSLTELERLWIGVYDPVPPEQIEHMRQVAPNCVINTTTRDPTEEDWRTGPADEAGYPAYDPRYALLRQQFGYTESDYNLIWNDPLFYHP